MRMICLCLTGLALLTTGCTAARCAKWEPRNNYVYVAGVGVIAHQVDQCVLLEEPKETNKGE